MQVKTSCQHWGGTKVSKRCVVIVLCIKVKYYKSLKRSLYQSLKRRNDIFIIDNVGASILCSLAVQWKSLSLDILKHILMSRLFKLFPTFLKALLQLIKASIKCNCSLSEPRRICNIFFFPLFWWQKFHTGEPEMWAQLPRQFLSHLLMLKCIICCIIILNYAATTEIVSNYTKWVGVQCVNGMKLTYFTYGTPAACKTARVFLLIDLCEGGEWNSCQPLPSNMFVSFFSLLNTSISFVYACVAPPPLFSFPSLYVVVLFYFFKGLNAHCVGC